jgi:hypothetical protein
MSRIKFINLILVFAIMAIAMSIACSQPTTSNSKYSDPSKTYAAFIVQNSPNAQSAIDKAIFQLKNDGIEIGPMEYYNAGTKDFVPIVKKLILGKQITCIFIIGNIMDMPSIRTSAKQAGFAGEFRFLSGIGTNTPAQ